MKISENGKSDHITNHQIMSEIQQIRKDLPKLKDLAATSLFSMLCLKFFYNNGNLSISDYESCYTDGQSDGGIDFVTSVDDDEGNTVLILAQSKTGSLDKNAIIAIFDKMRRTYKDFEDDKTAGYNEQLRTVLRTHMSAVEDFAPKVVFALFCSEEISDTAKVNALNKLQSDTNYSDRELLIFSLPELQQQIDSIKEPRECVEKGQVEFAKDHGIIHYTDHGILVNVTAMSLKKMYETYKTKGLFGQNLRYYIRDVKIDGSINNSLENRRPEFWFLNNGIIIGCENYDIDGVKIKLTNFSIINGCQTTTLIGEDKSKKQNEDFVIPCKIVMPPPNLTKEAKYSFITGIAEASNSQKPITDRDKKANAKEQKRLLKQLEEAEPPVYLSIKRSAKDGKKHKKNIESWQYVKNDELGQYVLSLLLQQPGTARSGKKKIFADGKLYGQIFRAERPSAMYIDILKLKNAYDKFQNKTVSEAKFTSTDHKMMIIYGHCHVLAIIGFMLKIKRGVLSVGEIKFDDNGDSDIDPKELWQQKLKKDNLRDRIFSNTLPDDYEKTLEVLFSRIVTKLYEIYDARKKTEKTVPNFLKTDQKYFEHMIKGMMVGFYYDPQKSEELEKMLQIFDEN